MAKAKFSKQGGGGFSIGNGNPSHQRLILGKAVTPMPTGGSKARTFVRAGGTGSVKQSAPTTIAKTFPKGLGGNGGSGGKNRSGGYSVTRRGK